MLSDGGDPASATEVLIQLERDRRAAERPSIFFRLWNWVLEWTVAYGYSAWRAAYPALVMVAIGWMLFRWGYRSGIMVPSDRDAFTAFRQERSNMGYRRFLRLEPDRFKLYRYSGMGSLPANYPRFSAFVYSLDSLVPIVDLGQKKSWIPSASLGSHARWGFTTGWWLRTYLWLHIAVGWLLTTLVVAGVTGFVKH